MCRCTPNVRTPFCGGPTCQWPASPVGVPSHLPGDHLLYFVAHQLWYSEAERCAPPNVARGRTPTAFMTEVEEVDRAKYLTLARAALDGMERYAHSVGLVVMQPPCPLPPPTDWPGSSYG